MYIEWDEKYSVGSKLLDDQHKRLVYLIRRLDVGTKQQIADDMMGDIIDDLINYATSHFGEEAELMLKSNYPNFSSHKSEHDYFINKLMKFIKHYLTSSTYLSYLQFG